MADDEPIRIREVEVLSDDWAVLKKTTLDYRRRDGSWETQVHRPHGSGSHWAFESQRQRAPKPSVQGTAVERSE